MYGNTSDEVKKNLTEVIWLPKHLGKKIIVSKLNGIAEKMQQAPIERCVRIASHQGTERGRQSFRQLSHIPLGLFAVVSGCADVRAVELIRDPNRVAGAFQPEPGVGVERNPHTVRFREVGQFAQSGDGNGVSLRG